MKPVLDIHRFKRVRTEHATLMERFGRLSFIPNTGFVVETVADYARMRAELVADLIHGYYKVYRKAYRPHGKTEDELIADWEALFLGDNVGGT